MICGAELRILSGFCTSAYPIIVFDVVVLLLIQLLHIKELHISYYPARALRALGLLLADGAPTVGGGKTF